MSRKARDRYRFDLALFGSRGNVVFADFRAARVFADRMNAHRGADHPGGPVKASDVNAMGLIDEMLHVILARYRETVRPNLWSGALEKLEGQLGEGPLAEVLTTFVDEFPPLAVYNGEIDAPAYLEGATDGIPNRETVLEELMLLRLANTNPAFEPFRELFDDDRLQRDTGYLQCVERLEGFFSLNPGLEEGGQTLLDLLLAPVWAAPTSLEGQLAFIRGAWAEHLGDLVVRVLSSLDFVAEEGKPFFGFGPGPVEPPVFDDLGDAPQRYSADRDWMPRVVLVAKNVHVWLDQLSRRHDRTISTLDQIPDEELDRLASWGFTGLWLIGVWERSRASERIKRMMGDEEAVASAYSLADYTIAHDLGGEAAYDDLKDRALRRGIRMSTDMVPNHMGIDSRWMVEHPDWFIGLDESPFPGYTFNGADLCDDERVGIYLEDRYWDRSDAAVVFKRVDHWTGNARYIYHGNDGTTMPWNDTAQLDYRLPEVREAVIQTILHVARRSPVIRFDAAMTLAKKHYQRLWFPEPGSGGDIPSRAEHGMSRADFDAVMPEEFWREVVDRVAAEAPDTLLLAEAFWLLEGYFVRTLGMHRVYNSAFMNMLRDERNADYRTLIKSTLEYDPQILKRYVNFMSNPDERTAIDQFGTDGKYFGVAVMMATLPGLPMFGHGQVEGYAEKYGMEFRRPRWDESPDDGLIRRHERQLAPLLHRRGSFAEVDRFLLYDLVDEHGRTDENVFAYSNEVGGVRSLVIYHNTFADTRGWLRGSTAKMVREGDDSSRLEHFPLAVGLGLTRCADRYLAFRDVVDGLEYLRPSNRLFDEGLYVELDAYRCRVFVDLRELVDDDSGALKQLEADLGGEGVASVEGALKEKEYSDILEPLAEALSAENLQSLYDARSGGASAEERADRVGRVLSAFDGLVEAVAARLDRRCDPDPVVLALRRDLQRTLVVSELDGASGRVRDGLDWWAAVLGWLLVRRLGEVATKSQAQERIRGWFHEWLVGYGIERELSKLELGETTAPRVVAAIDMLLALEGWWAVGEDGAIDLRRLVDDLVREEPGRAFLGVNTYDGVIWYRSEAFDEVLGLLWVMAAVESWSDPRPLTDVEEALARLAAAGRATDYRVANLLAAVEAK